MAKQTVGGNSNAEQFSVDTFVGTGGGGGSTTSANDDIHNCSDDRPTITLTVASGTNICTVTCTLTATVSAGGSHPLNHPERPQFPGTVNFMVNGQNVGSKSVNDPSDTVSLEYTVTSSGSATISAQVINSVLYDASDSVTATLNAGGGSPPPGGMGGGGGSGGGGGGNNPCDRRNPPRWCDDDDDDDGFGYLNPGILMSRISLSLRTS